jgi:hypothetical protein
VLHPSGRAPSLIVLGTDALLAARPSTPVQLAHACLALGYDGVVPGSWGDELVADAAMRRLEEHAGPAVLCTCPAIVRRLLQGGSELQPFLVPIVAPPVAVARYLRELWAPTQVHLTFAGNCDGAVHEAIDARLTPAELLASIADRGIVLAQQPEVFEEVIPPDRRRYHSLPGGVPAPERLRERCGRALLEVRGDDVAMEIAQILLSETDVLVDAGAALGCACMGAEACGVRRTARDGRAALDAIEPPRANGPVLVELRTPLALDLTLGEELPTSVVTAAPVVPPPEEMDPPAPHQENGGSPHGEPPTPPTAPTEEESSERPDRRPERPTPRSFAARRRPGERARHPSAASYDRRRFGFEPILDSPSSDDPWGSPAVPGPSMRPVVDAFELEPELDAEGAEEPDDMSDASAAEPPEAAPSPAGWPHGAVGSFEEPEALAADATPEAAERAEPSATPAGPPAQDEQSEAVTHDAPQWQGPSEMDRLRHAAEAALAPFIARVEAMGEPASALELRSPPPARPAPPPVEEPRPTDVATPIAIAREPGVMPWDRVLERNAPSELRDPEAPRVPTLKSVAAASRASSFVDGALTPVTPLAATPLQARATQVIVPRRARRWPWILAAAVIVLVVAAAAAMMLLRRA